MLAEFLSKQGEWTQVMPGARACLFSLCERSFPLPLRLEPLHFEVLFCRVRVTIPARQNNCDLLGGLTLNTDQVRRWMVSRGGCAVEGPSRWSQAAFADLDRLPQSERARWCVWKSVELLYLLSAQGEPAAEMAPVLDQEMIRTLAETRRYMEENLDEPLSISTLSRRACLSATTFKEGFRRLYGLPVHTWLQQRRMERAAELLRDSSLSVLGVAQSVGYSSASQFSAAFRRQYGMSPTMYRKMSEPA